MIKMCPFKEHDICNIWIDYIVNQAALDEATELCNDNWVEILALRERINLLESILKDAGLQIPPNKL